MKINGLDEKEGIPAHNIMYAVMPVSSENAFSESVELSAIITYQHVRLKCKSFMKRFGKGLAGMVVTIRFHVIIASFMPVRNEAARLIH